MPTNTTGPIKDVSKEVKYLNKDFEGFRNDLIEYAKTYFPTTYTDFNESSPGMMFIEMAAYIGDVLSYYVDSQFKESILAYAEEKRTSQALIAVEKAERDYDRTKALYADSVATLEQLQNAESQLQNAQQNLRAAQFNQNESRIVAPANGTIQKILVKENEITGAGNPIIIFGAANTGKVLITNLSDVEVVKIKSSDKATLQFDAWHEQTFSGQVLEIAGMATPSTGTYEVKIQVDDRQNKLLPGFIGSATITSSNVKPLLEIPIESLVHGSEKTGKVYKVVNGQAIKQEVQIAKILNHKLLISSGLSNEDQVITEGLGRIKGDSIAIHTIH